MHHGGDADVQVGHPPVEKVEDLCPQPAVELGFDSLGVCVGGELLTRVLSDQKQCVVLGVGDLELVSAERADLLCGCVRLNKQSFGCAACVYLLQGHTEIVCLDVQGGFRSGVIPESRPQMVQSAGRCGVCATGGECFWSQSSEPELPALPGSS